MRADVMCDRQMFESAALDLRLSSVLEEVQVLALERSQIPFLNRKIDLRWSFNMAHMKVCTSITSGWWREFAWENYDAVQSMYDPNYVTRFWSAVESGIVKSYNKTHELRTIPETVSPIQEHSSY